MVKIFVGNLAQNTTEEELRSLFSQYGTITECDIVAKSYGFVHMDKKTEADEAIRNLHHYELNGQPMNVEMSRGKPKASTKLHVSNLGDGCTPDDLRAKFEEYGPVVECDIVKDYAFVHMERMKDAMEAISGLDNTAFQGKLMSVQLSTSRLRTMPGMGDQTGCFVCGKQGHWSKDCPYGQNGGDGSARGGFGYRGGFRGGRGHPGAPPAFGPGGFAAGGGRVHGAPPSGYMGELAYGPGAGYMGGPPPPPVGRRPAYGGAREYAPYYSERYGGGGAYSDPGAPYERYGSVDFYEQFRAHPYAELQPSYPSPSSSSSSYERPVPSAAPAPAPAAAAAPPYPARDRSPIRRVAEGYAYERARLSPTSAVARDAEYAAARPRYTY